MYESEVGTPRHVAMGIHRDVKSLHAKVLGALENLRGFGARFNHELERDCAAAIEQVRNLNPRELPMNEWREWMVTDRETGVTLVVRLRRVP